MCSIHTVVVDIIREMNFTVAVCDIIALYTYMYVCWVSWRSAADRNRDQRSEIGVSSVDRDCLKIEGSVTYKAKIDIEMKELR